MNWISVKDKLPDNENYVLIRTDKRWYAIGKYETRFIDGKDTNQWHIPGHYSGYFVNAFDNATEDNVEIVGVISHWMEIPE